MIFSLVNCIPVNRTFSYKHIHEHTWTHLYLPLCKVALSWSHVPPQTEWVGVKAMTTCIQMWICIKGRHSSASSKKKHTNCILFDLFLQIECSSSWGAAGTEAAACCSVPQLPGLCPGTRYLTHKTCPAQIHWLTVAGAHPCPVACTGLLFSVSCLQSLISLSRFMSTS